MTENNSPDCQSQHVKSIDFSFDENEAFNNGFHSMKKAFGNRNIDIEDIVSLMGSEDIKNAAQKVSIRISESSVSQMNMVAFDCH